jgi:hypothetical protein
VRTRQQLLLVGAAADALLAPPLLLAQVLKRVLNHERPGGAPKSDPGMPSSHANSERARAAGLHTAAQGGAARCSRGAIA